MDECILREADKIFFLRRKLGLTQSHLARMCRISPAMLSALEAGREKPSVRLANTLAAALLEKAPTVFPSLFNGQIDPETEAWQPRLTPLRILKPLSALEGAMRTFRIDEKRLSVEECRLIAQAMGKSLWRAFPDRFDRLGNEISCLAKKASTALPSAVGVPLKEELE